VISLEEAFELQIWFIVKSDRSDLPKFKSRLVQHICDRLVRKGLIMLFAGKPLLVGSRDYFSIDDQCRSTVMIKS
jgi:hypothetical protein